MKRALVVTPRLPWPLDDGGRIALWQTVHAASREYETRLVSLVPAGEESHPLPREIEALGVDTVRVPHRPPPLPSSAWRGLVGRWPYSLARYRNRALSKVLAASIRDWKPAFALVNHLHLATYVDDLAPVPMVLREHNVEYVWMSRFASHHAGEPRGWYAAIQARRLRGAEAELCRASALVLAIQDEEREILRRLAPGARIETLPVGIDLGRFQEPAPVEPPRVLLIGSFGWPPNADGARAFLKEGWPVLRAERPDARLRLVGKDMSKEFARAAADAGAEVAGYVASMPDEFARATALVVPLWVGAGARVKIVEALAARVPVVSTSLGAEGLGLTPGRDYVLAETPRELARGVAELLGSPDRRRALSLSGYEHARSTWSLDAVSRIQNALCAEIARA